jgi:hypothetical protein
MPRREETRREVVDLLGPPRNKVDERILEQLAGLAGKRVVFMYGLHLTEHPAQLAAMKAEEEIGEHPDIGFVRMPGVHDYFRALLVVSRLRIPRKRKTEMFKHLWHASEGGLTGRHNYEAFLQGFKAGRVKPGDLIRRVKQIEDGLVNRDVIASRNYDREGVNTAIRKILRPDYFIDIHGTPDKAGEAQSHIWMADQDKYAGVSMEGFDVVGMGRIASLPDYIEIYSRSAMPHGPLGRLALFRTPADPFNPKVLEGLMTQPLGEEGRQVALRTAKAIAQLARELATKARASTTG